jgi:hypothetical protein
MDSINRTWHQLLDVLFFSLQPKDVLTIGLEAAEAELPTSLARRLFRVTDTTWTNKIFKFTYNFRNI